MDRLIVCCSVWKAPVTEKMLQTHTSILILLHLCTVYMDFIGDCCEPWWTCDWRVYLMMMMMMRRMLTEPLRSRRCRQAAHWRLPASCRSWRSPRKRSWISSLSCCKWRRCSLRNFLWWKWLKLFMLRKACFKYVIPAPTFAQHSQAAVPLLVYCLFVRQSNYHDHNYFDRT